MYRYPTNYISITNGFHTGKSLDFGWCGHHNQNVYSCGNGKVYKVEFQKTGGNTIFIEHTNGNISCYGHLDTISVTKGQSVTLGEKIGTMGATGQYYDKKTKKWKQVPEHLHFGIYKNKKNIYGNAEINPFDVCYVYPNQDATKVKDTYKKKLKYFEDAKIWEVGDYKLLYDKCLRKNHNLGLNEYKVKECSSLVKQYLTSKKPNDIAKLKKGTEFKVRQVYKETNGRVWGMYAGMWLVLCNVDKKPQAKRL